MKEKEWIVPVVYESCGFIKVTANTPEEACENIRNNPDDYPLPNNAEYVDGSFDLSASLDESISLTEIYTDLYEKGEIKNI